MIRHKRDAKVIHISTEPPALGKFERRAERRFFIPGFIGAIGPEMGGWGSAQLLKLNIKFKINVAIASQ